MDSRHFLNAMHAMQFFFSRNLLSMAVRSFFESALTAFDIPYPSIGEFQVQNGTIYFTQTNAVSGKNHLFMKKPDTPVRKLYTVDHDIKSGLNCYGAAALAVDGAAGVLALSKNVLYRFNENGYQTEVTLPEGDYGDPIVGGKSLFMVRDICRNQALIRYDIENLFNGTQSEPDILDSEKNHFYGNLDLTFDNRFVTCNKWTNGTPFDDANVFAFDVLQQYGVDLAFKNRSEIDAAKYPRCRYKEGSNEVMFISDKTGYDDFVIGDILTKESTTFHCQSPGSYDIGEPNWLMGLQWPYVYIGDTIVYATVDKLYVYKGDKKLKEYNVDNITLMHFDKVNPHMVYMKAKGPLGDSIMCLDLNSNEMIGPSIVYKAESLSPEFIIVPSLAEYAGIRGYLYTPKNVVEEGSRKIIIWLHGGPAMRIAPGFDARKNALVAADYYIFVPAFAGSGGFGPDLRKRLDGNWGKADAEDIISVARAIEMPGDEIFLIGSSAGAFLAYYSIARAPEGLFTAASVVASFYDLGDVYRTAVPFEAPYLARLMPIEDSQLNIPEKLIEKEVPIAIFHGENDPVVNSGSAGELARMLVEGNVHVVFKQFEGEGHGLKKKENIIYWLQETMCIFSPDDVDE